MSALLIKLDPADGQERMTKIMRVAKLLSHHAKEFSLTDAEKKTFIDAIRNLSVVATEFRKYYFYKVHPEAATDEIKRMITAIETKYKGLTEENLQRFLQRAKSIVGKEREKRKEPTIRTRNELIYKLFSFYCSFSWLSPPQPSASRISSDYNTPKMPWQIVEPLQIS